MSTAPSTPATAETPRPDPGFARSAEPEPHRSRTKWILERHPEVRSQIGRNPHTFWIIAGGVLLQLGLAFALRSSPWWLIGIVALLVGAFANHALWVLIHECTHNLLFRTPGANTAAGILANLPHMVPSSVMFQRYHLKHHAFQGVYELDADIPNRWEARLVGSSAILKAIWLALFPITQMLRPPRLKEIKPIDRWVVLNLVAQTAFDVAVWVLLGPGAFFYMLASLFFGIGFHPLGARWIQEHYMVFPGQETNSYYGPLNPVALNVGYHNEHHDFPSVPWNRLPEVKRIAPEAYDTLGSHKSWTKLLLLFIFDPRITLFSRTLRDNRGRTRFDNDVNPDRDLAAMQPAAEPVPAATSEPSPLRS